MRPKLLAAALCCGVLLAAVAPAARADGKVRRIKVLADKAPDFSSRQALVDSVTRGCKTNDEKAVAIYNLCRYAWYHRQYPREKGGIAALKYLNVYGWGLCGGQHAVLCSLWEKAGFDTRFIGWRGHTTVECRYDNQWHYFDTFLKCYFWKKDANAPGGRTVASQADLAADGGIIDDGIVFDKARRVWYATGNRFEVINDKANWTAPAFFVCGDTPKGVHDGVKGRGKPGEPNKKRGHMGINFDEKGYDTDVDLAAGMSLELMWKALPDCWYWMGAKGPPYHTCTDKDFRNCPAIGPILEPYCGVYQPRGRRSYANGVLLYEPDLSSDAFLAGLAGSENVKVAGGRLTPADASAPASITVELQLPYVFVKAAAQADGATKAEVSNDGKAFKEIDLTDFSEAVNGKYRCLLKLTVAKALKKLRIQVIVQHNRCSLPYLSAGKNRITVSVADPKQLGDNRLAVTYAYSLGSRYWSYEQFAERDYELGRGHKAAWSDRITAVQKVFAAKDLPATFEIDCPTPTDRHPVYPRMHFLRREVLAPGEEPLPVPEGALEAKLGPGEELKGLPYPFHMGIARPPKRIVRPTVMKKLPLEPSHVVDFEGKTYDNHWIKTRPKKPEWWVMLIGGELKGLPRARDIASARLCLPVTWTHPKANVKVGVVALRKPFEKGKPYAEEDFGAVVGTSVLPRQEKPGPVRYYKFDITRYVKSVAAGDAKFCGLAIKVLPDRSVDDGWTVRIDVTKDQPTHLALDVYADGRPARPRP